MFKIMVVEDDIKIRELVVENIQKWGFETVSVEDFNETLNVFLNSEPHLILMDINLPCFDGFYWCNKIREVSKVPVIFVSSRNTNMDIVMAINMGGDDFIQKPFSLEVLMAKINALIRRTYSYANVQSEVIEYDGALLNLKDGTLLFNDEKIELTKNEFRILYILMKNNNSVVSRDKIMESLWENESFVDDNTLTVNINRLRKKLADAGLEDFIKTKKGQGYIVG